MSQEEEARETPHCATCRRSALEGRAHSFTRAHARHVHAEMSRLLAKVELAVRELPTPRVFTVQPGGAAAGDKGQGDEGDRAFWCPMCRTSARMHARDGRLVVALAGTVQHLASPDHERSIHRYWKENHLDQGLKKNYLITPMQCNKFLTAAGLALSAFEEEEERLLKEEAELIRQQEKKRQELMSSLSEDWPGVTPLSSMDPRSQSELHASDSSGPMSTHVHKVVEKPRGNIHTGATPPWLMNDDGGGTNGGDGGGDGDTKEQRDGKAPVIGPSYEAFLHHRAQSRQTPLPPGRVGATFDRLAAASDPAWLPQFSNAWNTGRRGPQRLRHQKKRDWRGEEWENGHNGS
ncbi:centrosomal AT-AC splicing factor [Lampetra fluviatilis]